LSKETGLTHSSSGNVTIRSNRSEDLALIEALYIEAFPAEDLLPLVQDLLNEGCGARSLVADVDGALVAHVAFTACAVSGSAASVALLGPLAVNPNFQKQGLGSRLIREGLSQMTQAGIAAVFVLGDPGYYRRFGFTREANISPPYALVPQWLAAWQSRTLAEGSVLANGRLSVPAPWDRPSLWSP
jgi:putative acetyltransferase